MEQYTMPDGSVLLTNSVLSDEELRHRIKRHLLILTDEAYRKGDQEQIRAILLQADQHGLDLFAS